MLMVMLGYPVFWLVLWVYLVYLFSVWDMCVRMGYDHTYFGILSLWSAVIASCVNYHYQILSVLLCTLLCILHTLSRTTF
jgi:hypothetical protein